MSGAQKAPAPAAPANRTDIDVAKMRTAIAAGLVPQSVFSQWMRTKVPALQKTIEQYSRQRVRMSISAQKGPSVAWTNYDADQHAHIRIDVESIKKYAVTYDPVTKQISGNERLFGQLMLGLAMHEMGHVIHTPRLIDMLPEAALAYARLHGELKNYIDRLSPDLRGELFASWVVLDWYAGYSYKLDAPLLAKAQEAIAQRLLRIEAILHDFIQNAVDDPAPVPRDYATQQLDKVIGYDPTKPGGGRTTDGVESLHNLRTGQGRYSANDQLLMHASRMWHESYLGVDVAVDKDTLLIGKRIVVAASPRETSTFFGDAIGLASTSLKSHTFGYDRFTNGGSQKHLLAWKRDENVLEDQLLETQLSRYYGGLGQFFNILIHEVIVPQEQRYPLTAGRLYLSQKLRDEDRAAMRLAARTNHKIPLIDGWDEWLWRIPAKYVVISGADPKGTGLRAYYQALTLLVERMFIPDNYTRIINPLDEETRVDLDEKQRAEGDKGEQDVMAKGAKDSAQKAERIAEQRNEDPLAQERAETAALLAIARHAVANAARLSAAHNGLLGSVA
jgi:hypothetical protein